MGNQRQRHHDAKKLFQDLIKDLSISQPVVKIIPDLSKAKDLWATYTFLRKAGWKFSPTFNEDREYRLLWLEQNCNGKGYYSPNFTDTWLAEDDELYYKYWQHFNPQLKKFFKETK
jgi:hypothetical protein